MTIIDREDRNWIFNFMVIVSLKALKMLQSLKGGKDPWVARCFSLIVEAQVWKESFILLFELC